MGRREENKQRKREALEGEGLRLFLEHGYDRASIEQITQAAGVARGTFYLYFPDKQALFGALMDRWFDPMSELLADVAEALSAAASADEAWQIYRDMASGLAFLGLAHSDVILLAFRESRTASEAGLDLRRRESALLDRVVGFTEVVAARGLLDVPDARIACLVVYGGVERLFYEVLTGSELGDPARVAGLAVSLFERAMGRVSPEPAPESG